MLRRLQRPQRERERPRHALHLADTAVVEELAQSGRARVVRPHEAVHQQAPCGRRRTRPARGPPPPSASAAFRRGCACRAPPPAASIRRAACSAAECRPRRFRGLPATPRNCRRPPGCRPPSRRPRAFSSERLATARNSAWAALPKAGSRRSRMLATPRTPQRSFVVVFGMSDSRLHGRCRPAPFR